MKQILWGFFLVVGFSSACAALDDPKLDETVFLISGDFHLAAVQLMEECRLMGCKGSTSIKTAADVASERQKWIDMIKKEIDFRKGNAEIVDALKSAFVIGIDYFDNSAMRSGESKGEWKMRMNAEQRAYSMQISKVKVAIELSK